MHDVFLVLQVGIVLTTPVFFLAALMVLWRVLRTTEATMAVAVHVKRQIEILRGGGMADAVRSAPKVQQAEDKFPGAPKRHEDADHRG